MGYELSLPKALRELGWKVKIRDRERSEDPHVTILQGTRSWRYNIRTGGFMDRDPSSRAIPAELMLRVLENLEVLRREWDLRYPGNRVRSEGDG